MKYEDVYIKGYETVLELEAGLGAFLPFYNDERHHQAPAYRTPAGVSRGRST